MDTLRVDPSACLGLMSMPARPFREVNFSSSNLGNRRVEVKWEVPIPKVRYRASQLS